MTMTILKPRLSRAEARATAIQYLDGNQDPPYTTWVSRETAELFRITAQKQPQIWQGTWVWPDGMVSMLPVLSEDVTLSEALGEMYEAVRSAVERQVLMQFPPAGEA